MRLPLTLWLVIAGLVARLDAQTNSLPVRSLSLDESMQLALQHNLDLQIERLSPEIARFNLSGAYGSYEPVFTLDAGKNYLDQVERLDPKKPNPDFPYQETTDTVEPSITGRLPTGLTYDLGARFDSISARTDFSATKDADSFPPSGIRLTNEFFAFAGITLRQPLLKDLWIDSVRERIWVNKKTLKISELALRYQVMTILTKVQLAYFELVYAREKEKVEQSALALAQRLLEQSRRRVELGDLPPLEATQAESQVESAQASVVAAHQAFVEQEDAIKRLLSDDFRAWADVRLEPADPLLPRIIPLDRSQSWQTALTARPDYLQAKIDLERRDIILRYEFNQLFPSLDVVGSYGSRAAQNSFEAAAGDLRNFTHPSYMYGMIFSVPLGNETARNRHKATRAEQQQAQLQFKKLEQEILVQVDLAVKAAESHFRRLSSTRAARVFSEAALEAEEKKFANGLSTSFVVLELQQRLTNARSVELRALADYNKALAQLTLAEGSALEKNHFSLGTR